jgi:hypothetical protein
MFYSIFLSTGLNNVGGSTQSSEVKEDIIALQSKLKVMSVLLCVDLFNFLSVTAGIYISRNQKDSLQNLQKRGKTD